MIHKAYTTPKAGLEDDRNEDAFHVRTLNPRELLVSVSDGASTGVFSRNWSKHLATGIDSAWLDSPEAFLGGLDSLRATFKPEITRPTAQRKFLMEGSYATILAVRVRVPLWWLGRLRLKLFCVGDVTILIFDADGEMLYSFPQKTLTDFGNTPELYRSSAKLQEKTPFALHQDEVSAPRSALVAVLSDAIAEYIFTLDPGSRLPLLKRVAACKDNAEFRTLADELRAAGMKNDDATAALITHRPDYYFGAPASIMP